MNFISAELLSDGTEIKIYQSNTLPQSPATAFLLKNFSELMINKFVPSYGIPFNNDNSILWSEANGEVAGGLCYSIDKMVNRCWIEFSFTEHQFRKKGMYKVLHTQLENICKSKNINTIANYVHVDNQARLKSCESVGMKPHFIRMVQKL